MKKTDKESRIQKYQEDLDEINTDIKNKEKEVQDINLQINKIHSEMGYGRNVRSRYY